MNSSEMFATLKRAAMLTVRWSRWYWMCEKKNNSANLNYMRHENQISAGVFNVSQNSRSVWNDVNTANIKVLDLECSVLQPHVEHSEECGRLLADATCRACVSPLATRRHTVPWLISTVALWLTLLFRATAAPGEGFRHSAGRGDESAGCCVMEPLEIQAKSDVGFMTQSSTRN